jgi:hypothetical protein
MAVNANVVFCRDLFVAELSDGQRIERPDLHNMAKALCRAGVRASQLSFDWRTGAGMITAGKQVALSAELRLLEGVTADLPAAA